MYGFRNFNKYSRTSASSLAGFVLEMADRRKMKDTGPPPPLLLLPASQSLTFASDESGHNMSGILMPVPLLQKQDLNVAACGMEQSTEILDPGSSSVLQSTSDSINLASLKTSQSLNTFRMSGRPQYAVPTHDYYFNLSQTELPHSSSASNLDQTSFNQTNIIPPPPSNAPPVAGFIPSSSSSVNSTLPKSSIVPPTGSLVKYIPVTYHWFFCKNKELRQVWEPFSFVDSINLEENFRTDDASETQRLVSTDGGRYDVDVPTRTRAAIYWEEPESKVRRCSWFYRPDGDVKLVPYDEEFAEKLEESYKNTLTRNEWHQKLEFLNGDTIIMHSPTVIMHFTVSQTKTWNSTALNDPHPRMVKRGTDDLENIFEGEPTRIDHLVFVVHGIGPTCDLRFRNIVECVDDFRTVSHQILSSHFKNHQDEERIGHVEFLPVRWHAALHGDATGIDRKLKAITLNSIGKLRQFTNDTLIDVLFYGSPAYAQKIADTIGNEMNRLFQLFRSRNPDFEGDVSVAGHSLGSLILFDLLVHQKSSHSKETPLGSSNTDTDHTIINSESGAVNEMENETKVDGETDEEKPQLQSLTVDDFLSKLNLSEYLNLFTQEQIDIDTVMMIEDRDLKELGLPLGPRKKILCSISDYKNNKHGSSGHLLSNLHNTSQQQNALDETNKTCSNADKTDDDPILRSASSTSVNFVVGDAGTGIPFIKYPQLDFETANFFALGSPTAMFLTVRGVDSLGDHFHLPTCPGFFNIFHPYDPVAYRMEPMVSYSFPIKPVLMPHHKGRKRLHLELRESLSRVGSDLKQRVMESVKSTWRTINDFALAHRTTASRTPTEEAIDHEVNNVVSEMAQEYEDSISVCSAVLDEEYPVGALNQGRRVDYVLQEKPIESFNEYLFALSSHGCYWDSEDTILLILKEIYARIGIFPQKQGPDPSQIQPPPTTFPRHPMAQSVHFVSQSSGYNPQPFGVAPTPKGPAIIPLSEEIMPSVNSSNIYPPSNTESFSNNVAPLVNYGLPPESNTGPAPNFGPPPTAGFLWKT